MGGYTGELEVGVPYSFYVPIFLWKLKGLWEVEWYEVLEWVGIGGEVWMFASALYHGKCA